MSTMSSLADSMQGPRNVVLSVSRPEVSEGSELFGGVEMQDEVM